MKLIIKGSDFKKREAIYNAILEGLKQERKIKHKGYTKEETFVIILNPHLPSFITTTFDFDKGMKHIINELFECVPVSSRILRDLLEKRDILRKWLKK